MPSLVLATNFLAGSLLTILMPLGLLIVLAFYYMRAIRHVPEETPVSSPSLPPPEVVAAAEERAAAEAPPPPPPAQP